ncbi:hypothetical protein HanXRQr2_Chr06g0268321 [Helianthus annuus]|uniref:Uncharacterized protein n=1 Tax=Helianthus annuus TaxID=4232 RepID=A0A9K3NJS6_HELAN|nr:hypothetical protein HanXRQr2_Chr06g0268321 [Helianthus annuus]
MLRDANERQIDTCVEDDVKFPNFVNKDEITCILGEASACDFDEEILFKNQVQMCGQGKAKHKFSIRTQSHKDNLNKDSSDVYESHTLVKEKEMDGMTNYMTPARFPISHTHSTTSVAELLLRVQIEHDLPEGSTVNEHALFH